LRLVTAQAGEFLTGEEEWRAKLRELFGVVCSNQADLALAQQVPQFVKPEKFGLDMTPSSSAGQRCLAALRYHFQVEVVEEVVDLCTASLNRLMAERVTCLW